MPQRPGQASLVRCIVMTNEGACVHSGSRGLGETKALSLCKSFDNFFKPLEPLHTCAKHRSEAEAGQQREEVKKKNYAPLVAPHCTVAQRPGLVSVASSTGLWEMLGS